MEIGLPGYMLLLADVPTKKRQRSDLAHSPLGEWIGELRTTATLRQPVALVTTHNFGESRNAFLRRCQQLAPFSCPVHSGAPLSIRLGPLPRAWAFGTVRLRGENEHCRWQPPLRLTETRDEGERNARCGWVGSSLARREEEVPRVDARTPASKASAMCCAMPFFP